MFEKWPCPREGAARRDAPRGNIQFAPGHDVSTVQQAGSKGLKNGELIHRAAANGFVVLVTSDRSLPAQQNIAVSGLAVVLVKGSRMADVAGQAGRIQKAVAAAIPGTVSRVAPE